MADLGRAVFNVDEAAGVLFTASPAIRSVGVGYVRGDYGYIAVRNKKVLTPLSARVPDAIEGIPVIVVDSTRDPQSLVLVPHSGPGSPAASSLMPEQAQHRPLLCGLEIQNFDDDGRSGYLGANLMNVGTLGCFVELPGGTVAMLSNNHVVAGENKGVVGADQVSQPGVSAISATHLSGRLTNFVQLLSTPPGISHPHPSVVWNEVDAGVAETSVAYSQAYLPVRTAAAPCGTATVMLGEKVHKVGRTTGLTYGEVTQVAVVAAASYKPGTCWFKDCFIIQSTDGTTFSNHGDSGSAIVRPDGSVLGLLFAGNGTQTYACGIDHVTRLLGCTVI